VRLPTEEELRSFVDSGCRFYPRCPHRMDRCLEKQPPLYQIEGSHHRAACYLYDESPPASAIELEEKEGIGHGNPGAD
jgi:hypothetical protein